MANAWFRMYSEFATDPKVQMMSANAHHVAEIAHKQAEERRYCYPNWRNVEMDSGLSGSEFSEAFEELCAAGVVFEGFPSLLTALAEMWPIAPMQGPVRSARPSAAAWEKVRNSIFKRDHYTCQYCGATGCDLECDHVVPISRGGGNEDSNLTTACYSCNRSKAAKPVSKWKDA
jgi:hypothetical protein